MEALEPNMYVRLNCNYELGIGKTIGEIDEDNFIKTKFKDGFECSLPIYMIKKASHNIVDLIEVGDYVNGELVKNIEVDSYKDYAINSGYWCKQEEIKSILTKEMFENMSYEVK